MDGINSNRPAVVHWLKYLVRANILVKEPLPSKNGFYYSLNKDWEQWKWGVRATKLVGVRKPFMVRATKTVAGWGNVTQKRNSKRKKKGDIFKNKNKTVDKNKKELEKNSTIKFGNYQG